jgi:uncharacterized damage-inducible protein DinB
MARSTIFCSRTGFGWGGSPVWLFRPDLSTIIDWVASLSPEDMEGDLVYTSIVNPEPRRYPLWFALSHFFNHQTHHRGQITTLLTQLGVDVGVTDLIGLKP